MDSLDESLEDMASCASARASGLLLAKLSEVRYCYAACVIMNLDVVPGWVPFYRR